MISQAFEAGTGMKRSSVARSKRFQELLEQTEDGAFVSAYERAEMLYLGERLADTAFRRLPINVRRSAEAWAAGEGDSTTHLAILYDTITDWQQKLPSANRRQKACADAVLPNRYRFDLRAPLRPNCLGLAQMMVGYARVTGAEYTLADTLRRYDVDRTMGMYLGHMTIDSSLAAYDAFPSVRKYRRSVAKQRALFQKDLRVVLSADNYSLAHHALMVKRREDATWELVDPYMFRIYGLELLPEDIEILDGETRHDDTITYSLYPFVEHTFESMTTIVDVGLRQFEKMAALPFHEETVEFVIRWIDLAATYIAGEAEEIRDRRRRLGVQEVIPFNIGTKDKLKKQLYGEAFKRFLTEEEKELLARDDTDADAVYERMAHRIHTRWQRDHVMNRFLGLFLRFTYELQVHSYELLDIHPLIELNNAEYHLAAMTVNHLAVMNGVDATQLICHRPYSQFIIRDTMSGVLASNHDHVKSAHQGAVECLRSAGADKVLPALHSLL